MNRTAVREWLRADGVPMSVRFVFVSLWLHANDRTGKAFPSVATITTETGLNRRTVQRALRRLERTGDIVVLDQLRSGVTVYTVGGRHEAAGGGGEGGGNGQVLGAASGRPEEKRRNGKRDTFSPGSGWLRERTPNGGR